MIDRRNPGIDALRGLSILLVVLHHLGLRIPLHKTDFVQVFPVRLANGLNDNGYEAVFVFFVLSGFLITQHAIERAGALPRLGIGEFYRRRFARIAPSLLLLVGVLSVLHLLGAKDFVIERQGQSLGRAVLSAVTFHLNWYEGQTGYLPGNWDVLWSLSIEEVFYLLFPVLCLLGRRERLLAILVGALAVSLPFTHAALKGNEIWQEKAYLPGMSAIGLGVFAAIFATRSLPSLITVRLSALLGAAGLFVILFFEDLLWRPIADASLLVLTGSAALLACSAHWAHRRSSISVSPAHRLLASPWLGWLRSSGKLTYEIYLTHMFVVFPLVRVFRSRGADLANGWLYYLPALPITWLLGAVVARFFSQPAERLILGKPR